jgi:membrane-associated protease RseP (regulator of RpoE activity)
VSYLIGVLIFVVAILVSIMLHEAGHFATAKAFGMKATQFFVGFGTTVWSFRRGETEYGVKSLPLGGFVKILGMTSMEEDVDPADEPRSFRSKPGWQRVIVLSAGSFMHFTIAFVLLWVLYAGIGSLDPKSTIVTVSSCVPSGPAAKCAPGDPGSPAAKAGIRTGDQIVAVAGQPVHGYLNLIATIRKQKPGAPVRLTLVRDGKRMDVTAVLAQPSWDKKKNVAFLGVSQVPVYTRSGPIQALGQAGSGFGTVVSESVTGLARIPCALPVLFSRNRSTSACGQISSVVGAASVTGQVVAHGYDWRETVADIMGIVISVNIFVGIFNLLPLLPLDGGHIAIVLYERARASVARWRRRPDPGLVDISKLIPVSVGVFAVLICLSLLLVAADIFNPLNLSQ